PPESLSLLSLSLHDALPILAHFYAQSHQDLAHLWARTQSINHLDHAHQRDRIKKVITRDSALIFASLGNGGDGQGRRIGTQNAIDRKSTRLNSSHVTISYAV